MKVLFVGLGSIATKHIRDLLSVSRERDIPCDITVLRRQVGKLPEELEEPVIRQIDALDGAVYDVAFVTNPTNLHYEALELLKGKARFYFIEKPIFESCCYDRSKLSITDENAYVACPLRHSPVYEKIKEITESTRVYNARIICSSYLPDWRPGIDYRKNYSALKVLGGGVSLDLIHEIDYMTGLFGFPEELLNVQP